MAGQSLLAVVVLAGLVAGAGVAGVVFTQSDFWATSTEVASDDALRKLEVELDLSGARGIMRDEDGDRFLSTMKLEVHVRSGQGLFLGNLSIVVDAGDAGRTEWGAGNASLVETVRDVDSSLRYDVANAGDLVEIELRLLGTPVRVGAGDSVVVLLDTGEKVTELGVKVPAAATERSVVELAIEVRGGR